jgi:hypothetical protein
VDGESRARKVRVSKAEMNRRGDGTGDVLPAVDYMDDALWLIR